MRETGSSPRVGELLDGVDAAPDTEHLLVDAENCLQVAVLVGDLRGQQQLHLVVRRREKKRREQPGDVELGVEPVREHPHETVSSLVAERFERRRIGAKIELERRPVAALPVRVQRREWAGSLLEEDVFGPEVVGEGHRRVSFPSSVESGG